MKGSGKDGAGWSMGAGKRSPLAVAAPAAFLVLVSLIGTPVSLQAQARRAARLDERAHQNRDIVYFLHQPETHAFDLYHDYTESRPGVGTYINVVRAGSTVSKPSARVLDTGEELHYEVLNGEAIRRASLDVPDVTPQTQAVVFHFPPVRAGQSIRLRMYETYTDSARYTLVGNELVWDRSFGRPTNAVVLPDGWILTNSSIPATVRETADRRIRLDFVNPRPDGIEVLITARRRTP